MKTSGKHCGLVVGP